MAGTGRVGKVRPTGRGEGSNTAPRREDHAVAGGGSFFMLNPQCSSLLGGGGVQPREGPGGLPMQPDSLKKKKVISGFP